LSGERIRFPQEGQNGMPVTTLASHDGHAVMPAEGRGPVEDESDESLKNPINDLCRTRARWRS
jgi:hypothetical protein